MSISNFVGNVKLIKMIYVIQRSQVDTWYMILSFVNIHVSVAMISGGGDI